ncbi:MAG TPA: FKBP-type peptidyl-prolyl cis-trans isomerase [Ramlibacter sp.]|jgi:FKBP-type peptidyl-prolyl cis-trans isomerase FkpA
MRLFSLLTPLLVLATTSACVAQPSQLQTATGSAKVTTASGIVFESVVAGSGPTPAASDTVRVHYRGTFPDGREFDSSHKRGQPAEFPLNRVIPCWTEGVQMMRAGGKARLVCPPATAYGERGAGASVPPNATLHFEIELIAIVKR